MDQIGDMLDHDHSLEEMLAFIDAYDFGISSLDGHGQAVGPIGCFDSIEIEDTLVVSPEDAAPNIGHEFDVQLQSHGVSAASGTINDQDCSVSSSGSKPLAEPCKERGRVRERVVRLRGVVKQLEQQLEELTGLCRQKAKLVEGEELTENGENENTAVNTKRNAAESGSDVVTWQQRAIKQYAARRVAEKENMHLRERLEEQLRVAKRLERLIQGQFPD
ncbi:hypothetical protein PRIC1_012666 [Phytophthora ramorum]